MTTDGLDIRLSDIEAQLKKLNEKLGKKEELQISKEFKDIKKEMHSIVVEMKEIKKSMVFINSKFEDGIKMMEECKLENKDIREEMEKIKKQMMEHEKDRKERRKELIKDFQDNHGDEIELIGIPNLKKDKVKIVVEQYMLKLQEKEEVKNIKKMEQILGRDGRNGVIRIKFVNKEVRERIVNKAKKIRIIAEDLKIENCKNRIFTNEVIDQYSKLILFKARTLRKQYQWKYLWVKEGLIFLRKKDGDRAIKILNETDLDELEKLEKKEEKRNEEEKEGRERKEE